MNAARIAYTGLIEMHAQELAKDGHFLRTKDVSKDRKKEIDRDLADIGSALNLQAHKEIHERALSLVATPKKDVAA